MIKKTLCHLISGLVCFTLSPILSYALPQDPKVISGSAHIERSDHTMEIRPSDQAILHYSKFNIGKGEKVKFIQNSASSCVLNKVKGKDPSKIFGSLESNGKVFLVNSNGVYFGPDSQVNVGSLIVSTLNLADQDFLAGKYEFHLKDEMASIQNEGILIAEESIALISPQIQNKGLIQAKTGMAVLASGTHVTLDFIGDGLLQFSVEGPLKEALIENLGEIKGSMVSMKLPTAKKAISELVNLDGAEIGEVFTEENGIIKLASSSRLKSEQVFLEASNLEIGGTIESVNLLGKGGSVHLLGNQINLKNAQIDASGSLGGGKVLIGGEYQGGGQTPYASRVIMDHSSSITSNALEEGDGGLVVLWSQNYTLFNGSIDVIGGPLGGNGGVVETSSLDVLNAFGSVDGSAPLGKLGSWLLDPTNLYLTSSGGCPIQCISSVYANCGCNETYIYSDCVTTDGSPVTICSTFPSCNIDLLLAAKYGIYVQSNISAVEGSLTFGACNNLPGTVVPVFFQNGSGISTNGRSVTFNDNTVLVLESGSMFIDLTNSNHPLGANLRLVGVQALDSSYTLEIKPGIGSTTELNTISTISTVNKYDDQGQLTSTLTTYPPKQITLDGVVTSFQTAGISTSGGPINLNIQPVTLIGGGVVPLNTTVGSSSGDTITAGDLNATTSGVEGVSINAGTVGGINIRNMGETTPLGSVTITGGSSSSVFPNRITTNGGKITLNNSFNLDQNLVLTTGGGTVDTSGATLNSSALINIVTSGGDVTLGSTQSSKPFTISTGSGNISAGNVTMTSTSGTFITTSGGALTFENITTESAIIQISPVPIQLQTNGTLSSFGSGSGAAINLSTVDGSLDPGGGELAPSFTVDAGSGILTVGGIGGNHPLGNVTISTAAANFAVPNISTVNRSIVINPSILLSQDTVLNTVFETGTGGSITLSSSVNGSSNYNFTLKAGNQTIQIDALGPTLGDVSLIGAVVTLNGSVNITSAGSILSINNSGILSITSGAISLTNGAFSQIGVGTTNLFQPITATSLSFSGPVTVGTDLTLTASSGSFTALSDFTGEFVLTVFAESDISFKTVEVKTINFTSNSGNISFTADLTSGSTTLNASSGSVSFQRNLTATTLNIMAGLGVSILGTTTLTDVGSIVATSGDISLQTVSGLSTFTLETDSGAISTGSVTASSYEATSSSSITLNGDLIADDTTLLAGTFIKMTGSAFILDLATMTATSGALSIGAELSAVTAILTAGNGMSIGSLFNVEEATLDATGGDIFLPQVLSTVSFNATADSGSFSSGIFNAGEATFDIFGLIRLDGAVTVDTTLTVQHASGLTITGITNVDQLILGDGSGTLSGTIRFEGPVTIQELTTVAQDYGVSFLNGGEIFSATTFNNTGEVTLQSGTNDILVFDGALISNALPTTVLGSVATTSGGMTFQSLNVLFGGASLTTAGENIEIAGTVTLNGNASFTSLGGDIVFSSTVDGPGGIQVSTSAGAVQFNDLIGSITPVAYVTAIGVTRTVLEGVIATGDISIPSLVTLAATGENLIQTSGSILLGDTDGISIGGQDLTLKAGRDITLGNLGQIFPLGTVLIESGTRALIKSMNTQGSIKIDIPTVLRENVTLDTTAGSSNGSNVTLNTIDGTALGSEGLVINAGQLGDVVLEGNIGLTVPLGSLEITAESILIESSFINITGDQNYHSPTFISPNITVFRTFGDITFYSSLDTFSDLSSLIFYMGGGSFTLLGNTGNLHMGDLSVLNSGTFSSQQITGHSLRVAGGRSIITLNSAVGLSGPGGIILDGGPIYLGGEVDATHLFFRSSGAMSNLSSPQPINIEGSTPFVLEYFNALGGTVGTPDNPIEINTFNELNVGANRRADFIGTPFQSRVFPIVSNTPCIVTFNGVTIIDCTTQPTTASIFNTIPKNLLYVPGIYSSWSWDNLSSDRYFKESPFYLGKNPRNQTISYIKPKIRKSKKVVIP